MLVTGASGGTGRRVVAALSRRNIDIRAFVRRKEVCDSLSALGASEFALGTLEDDASLGEACKGVDTVLHICPPMHPQEDVIAKRLTDICMKSGVERLILWSVLHPVVHVPHHRRKLEAETGLIESGMPYTILQPSRYMQHLLPIWKQVQESSVHSLPFSTRSRFSLVDLSDLAEAAAVVAAEDGHEFATYQLAGPQALSQDDCARMLSDLLGKPVRAEERPLDAFLDQARKNGMPEWRIENMAIMNRHYTAHGLVGNPNVLAWLLKRELHDFSSFVRRELLVDAA